MYNWDFQQVSWSFQDLNVLSIYGRPMCECISTMLQFTVSAFNMQLYRHDTSHRYLLSQLALGHVCIDVYCISLCRLILYLYCASGLCAPDIESLARTSTNPLCTLCTYGRLNAGGKYLFGSSDADTKWKDDNIRVSSELVTDEPVRLINILFFFWEKCHHYV